MMGVNSCMSIRQARGVCHCPACPRASGHMAQGPPPTLVLPPMALEPETTPVKDKKGSKMKVLKKIKKKIGLAPRSSCTGTTPNNLPPLGFHSVHGDNIRISRDGSTARRVESFCKGVAFSARPVRVNEKVYIRFVEISNSWSGVIRFGFTNNDPATLTHTLPKYACPDLTNKPGNWAKALGERFCEKDNILYYYVNSTGDVQFGINGEDKGLFFSGVDIRSPIWALVDVYGNCTAVQFVDPRAPNQVRRSNPSLEEERIVTGMRTLSVEETLPAPRYQNPLVPLSLHRTKGRNVQFISDRGVAARIDAEFCQGYVFTARPMRPGQTIVVQILSTETAYAGSLAIGLTSCDPASLRSCDLPDDAEQLLDRPEYWVVRRDAANGLRRGDELAVTLTTDGEVRVSRNGSSPITVMHVDHTLRLWAFVDIYGATQKVRMLTSQVAPPLQPGALRVVGAPLPAQPSGPTVLVVSLPPQHNANQPITMASAHYIEPIQTSSQLCLNSIAPIQQNLPYRRTECSNQNSANEALPVSCNNIATSCNNVATSCNNIATSCNNVATSCNNVATSCNNVANIASCNNVANIGPSCNNLAPIMNSNQINGDRDFRDRLERDRPQTSRHNMPSTSQNLYSVIGEGLTGTECTICYENPIDSVLYMCGHMCMCYRCAVQQWRGKGGGQCPLCRAQIKDVIRTYKS